VETGIKGSEVMSLNRVHRVKIAAVVLYGLGTAYSYVSKSVNDQKAQAQLACGEFKFPEN
jgi:hypothetical protein